MSRSMTPRSKELITSLPSYLVEARDSGHSTKRAKTGSGAKAGSSDKQLQKRELSSLALATGQYRKVPKPKKLVLEEDEYTTALEKIIQRDFFPDLPMLKAQAEYLDALESNDLDRMREIKLRFQTPAPSAAASTGTARSQQQKRGTHQHSAPHAQQQRQAGSEPFNTPLTTPQSRPQHEERDAADVEASDSAPAANATDATRDGQARSSNFEDTPAGGTTRAGPAGPDATPDVGQARAGKGVKGAQPQAQAAAAGSDADNGAHGEAGEQGRKPVDTALSLNQFLNKYTSEDNASFEKIIEDTNARMEKQYRKYFGEVSAKSKLALAAAENDKPLSVGYEIDTWRYVPRNALMYGPQSQVLSAADLIRMSDERRSRINHANTRFTRDPYAGRTGTGGTRTRTRATLGPGTGGAAQGVVDLAKQGEGTVDGSGTPMVNGYKLVATPSPVPGRDMDPLMTWGEIEGTPFRLDAGDSVHATPGPVFNIPPLPEREQVARKLTDKATKRRRKGHASAAAAAAAQSSSSAASTGARSPWGGTPTTSKATQRLRSMTPAAQRLAQNLWGRGASKGSSSASLNRALRTTTPRSRAGTGGSAGGRVGRSTPVVTPVATPTAHTPQTTPRRIGGRVKTPVIEQRGGESAAVSAAAVAGKEDAQGSGTAGLTDNLL